MTPGRRRRREYAEWLPELDLHVGSRWDRAPWLAEAPGPTCEFRLP